MQNDLYKIAYSIIRYTFINMHLHAFTHRYTYTDTDIFFQVYVIISSYYHHHFCFINATQGFKRLDYVFGHAGRKQNT